jgi:hypothetical protein
VGLTIRKRKIAMAELKMEIFQETYNNFGRDSLREFLSQKMNTETWKGLQKSTTQKIIKWFAK